MSAIPSKVELTVDTNNNCNWRCCLWCGHRVSTPVTEIRDNDSTDPSILDGETTGKVDQVFNENVNKL